MTKPLEEAPLQTVKEIAAKYRVTETTVRNWIRKGALHVERTPGGGIRILPEKICKSSQTTISTA